MKHIGKQNKGLRTPYAVCLGLLVSLIISAILTGVIAAAVSKEALSFSGAIIAVPFIQLLASFAGCLFACFTTENDKAISSGAVCSLYYILEIACSGLLLDGISGEFWIGLIASIGGWMAAIFLCTREKTTHKRAKHRKSYS